MKKNTKKPDQNKFFLKPFFKNEGLKEINFNIIWNQNILKRIKGYQDEIERNIQKIGEVEASPSQNFNLKDIYIRV